MTHIGIYNLQMQAMGGGEKLTLALAEHLSLTHNVTLFTADLPDIALLEEFFDVDLSRVKFIPLKKSDSLSRVIAKVRNNAPLNFPHPHFRRLQEFKLDLFINNSFASNLKCPARAGIFMCMFPHPATEKKIIDSYSKVIAISHYAAHWVRETWKREAEVIYPPCDDMGPPSQKEKIILHVGRFIADSNEDERHHKGQRVLLDAFKRLTDLHQSGWQLHLVGSVAPDKRSHSFVQGLKHEAVGLPVTFHFDAARDFVRQLYRKASVFWLATGYGWTEIDHPAKQEHFGIATCEAMSAGAVPVVYASGGQKEIVTNEVDGFLWKNIDELIDSTIELATDSASRAQMSNAAIQSSRRFGRRIFADSIDKLIERLSVKRAKG
jgi:glycosyltransferase involved in cell wall biosynthesis